jgi:hypothetical protein
MKWATGEEARRLDDLRKCREAGLHQLRHAAGRLLEAVKQPESPSQVADVGIALIALERAHYLAEHGVEQPSKEEKRVPVDLTSRVWIDQGSFELVEERLIGAWSYSRRVHIADEEAEALEGVSGPYAALCGRGCKVVIGRIDLGQREVCGDCRRILGEKRDAA